jgi:hypothetical protein
MPGRAIRVTPIAYEYLCGTNELNLGSLELSNIVQTCLEKRIIGSDGAL